MYVTGQPVKIFIFSLNSGFLWRNPRLVRPWTNTFSNNHSHGLQVAAVYKGILKDLETLG